MKKNFIIVIALLSCTVFMALKLKIDGIPRTRVPGSSIIYVPSGKHLKFASFGNSAVMADLIYLWAIQFYSNYKIPDRFKYLDHIFSIISELDPKYLDPYEVGALIAVYEAQDVELAFKILDRGLEKNPEQWIFPFQAGHYAQRLLGDFSTARDYYEKTMKIEGAPSQTERLAANASFKLMDYEEAWKSWLEIYQTATDERIKKIAANHLYNVKASRDIQLIKDAIHLYSEKFGRRPLNLEQLVRGGYLNSVPKDMDEKDYIYNPQTGEVRTETIWSKR
ncbi:tetratricopeptide repeat protein [Acidobacteriota bacterium]